MKRLGPTTVGAFRNRILNIHPALLPAYGGEGMYGDRVYEAVLAAGETETGPSVHLVDEEYDHGPVVLQYRVPVLARRHPGDAARPGAGLRAPPVARRRADWWPGARSTSTPSARQPAGLGELRRLTAGNPTG